MEYYEFSTSNFSVGDIENYFLSPSVKYAITLTDIRENSITCYPDFGEFFVELKLWKIDLSDYEYFNTCNSVSLTQAKDLFLSFYNFSSTDDVREILNNDWKAGRYEFDADSKLRRKKIKNQYKEQRKDAVANFDISDMKISKNSGNFAQGVAGSGQDAFYKHLERSIRLAEQFKNGQAIPNRGGGCSYSVDFNSGILRKEFNKETAIYYSWSDITYCTVEIDDKTVVETSTGSMLSRGLVGGVLLGGLGVLVGGLSAAKTTKREIMKVDLKLKFVTDSNDGRTSEIQLYRPGYFSGPNAEDAVRMAERIHDCITRAIQTKANVQTGTSGLSDQLATLAALHHSGALTDEQFEQAKAKLLC